MKLSEKKQQKIVREAIENGSMCDNAIKNIDYNNIAKNYKMQCNDNVVSNLQKYENSLKNHYLISSVGIVAWGVAVTTVLSLFYDNSMLGVKVVSAFGLFLLGKFIFDNQSMERRRECIQKDKMELYKSIVNDIEKSKVE